jgi:hypothetical protein
MGNISRSSNVGYVIDVMCRKLEAVAGDRGKGCPL